MILAIEKNIIMSNKSQSPIVRAPEFNIDQWIDKNGIKTKPIKLSDFKGRFKVLLCFQSWCPGCHSKGLPHLKKMVEALDGSEKITFLAVQTVFEGYHTNTYQKIIDIQKHYNLKIPFGHDAAKNGQSKSQFMTNYKTGGTPWFIFIDRHDNIVFSEFYLKPDVAIEFLKSL